MVGQIYPTELQLNKANSSDTEAPFLDMNLSISNGIVSSTYYDKRDDFNFEMVNFPFLDGEVPCSPSYGVYISQLIRFARVCSNVDVSWCLMVVELPFLAVSWGCLRFVIVVFPDHTHLKEDKLSKENQLSLPHQDDCNTRMDVK